MTLFWKHHSCYWAPKKKPLGGTTTYQIRLWVGKPNNGCKETLPGLVTLKSGDKGEAFRDSKSWGLPVFCANQHTHS